MCSILMLSRSRPGPRLRAWIATRGSTVTRTSALTGPGAPAIATRIRMFDRGEAGAKEKVPSAVLWDRPITDIVAVGVGGGFELQRPGG